MMMKLTRLILLAAGLAALGPMSPGVAQAAEPEQVFQFYCSQCHGLTGKGDGPNVTKNFPVSPRNFTNAEEMNKLTDADIKNVVLDGGPAASKSPMMPPWGKTLTEAEVDGLVKHLRKLCNCKGKPG